jgi:hypothetical protein
MDAHLRTNRMLRVPYTDDQVAHANADAAAQATPDSDDASDFSRRYPNAAVHDFDGDPSRVTRMDALIAYLQMLGAGVDFSTYHADAPEIRRCCDEFGSSCTLRSDRRPRDAHRLLCNRRDLRALAEQSSKIQQRRPRAARGRQ